MNRRTRGGPEDHNLPLLAVHHLGGNLRAIFTNDACHCVTLSNDRLSGDWAGYAMEHLQRRNPKCEALISIGCGADSSPRGGVLASQADAADSLGQEIAEEVQRLLARKIATADHGSPSLLSPRHAEARTIADAGAVGRAGEATKCNRVSCADSDGSTDRGEVLMAEVSYPLQTIFGGDELACVCLPGEVVVDYALRLKRELNGGYREDCELPT